ncbi:MAG: hypothetical protein KDA33_13605 [Phycisphaerales bacterium]|nr:hypothetical protein [Phycisphaerales bacterium]
MIRIPLILWFSVHTLAPTIRPAAGATDRPSDRCCCCASAATCKCGCERPSTTDESEGGSAFSACNCNESPAIIPTRETREVPAPIVATVHTEVASTRYGAEASAVHPHLRGPPPDLSIVQSTVLLV